MPISSFARAGGFAAPPFIHSPPKASRLSQNDLAANCRTRPDYSGSPEAVANIASR